MNNQQRNSIALAIGMMSLVALAEEPLLDNMTKPFGNGIKDWSKVDHQDEVYINVKWSKSVWGVGVTFSLDEPIGSQELWAIKASIRTVHGSRPQVIVGAITRDNSTYGSFPSWQKKISNGWKEYIFPISDVFQKGTKSNSQNLKPGVSQTIDTLQLMFIKPSKNRPDHDVILIKEPKLVKLTKPAKKPVDFEFWKRTSQNFMKWVTIDASYTVDLSKNTGGGIKPNSSLRGLFDLGLTLDFVQLFKWKNGKMFIDFQFLDGDNGSNDTGDFQAYSNIDDDDFEILSELWFERFFFDQSLRLKIGKVDVNSEFAYVDNGIEFINSSMGASPTIFIFPSYPDPAVSTNLFIYPAENVYAGLGFYDGSTQANRRTGTHGLDSFYRDPNKYFYVAEFGASWFTKNRRLPGRIGFGGWHHTGKFERFDGAIDKGTSGFHLVLDQTLWQQHDEKENEFRALEAFLQYGFADRDVSEVEHHLGMGLVLTRPFSIWHEDVCGLGFTLVDFADHENAGFTESFELAIEFFYKFQITSNVVLKPDFQYIIHPGGDTNLDDVFVPTLRMEVAF